MCIKKSDFRPLTYPLPLKLGGGYFSWKKSANILVVKIRKSVTAGRNRGSQSGKRSSIVLCDFTGIDGAFVKNSLPGMILRGCYACSDLEQA